jgi:hypothetical protein
MKAKSGKAKTGDVEAARRLALARRLAACPLLIKATLVVNRRKCGNPKCRCAEGRLHESLAFTFKDHGRSVLAHVPKSLEGDARKAEKDYKKLKKMVDALSSLNLESFRRRAKLEKEKRKR